MPEHGQGSTQTNIARLNNKVVLYTDYSIIREKFTWTEGDRFFSQTYKCLAVPSDKVTVVSSMKNDLTSSVDPAPQNCENTDKTVSCNENYCISPFKESTLKQFLSQHIVVQHKTMASVPQQGKPARYYLLLVQ